MHLKGVEYIMEYGRYGEKGGMIRLKKNECESQKGRV